MKQSQASVTTMICVLTGGMAAVSESPTESKTVAFIHVKLMYYGRLNDGFQ